MKIIYSIKIAIILLIVLSGCSSYKTIQKPTLEEKQEMYYRNKKPLKAKDIIKIAFWVPTTFIFLYVYGTTVLNY